MKKLFYTRTAVFIWTLVVMLSSSVRSQPYQKIIRTICYFSDQPSKKDVEKLYSLKRNNTAKVVYTKPNNFELEIPMDTLYPIQHFFSIIGGDLNGKFINNIVFTGEDDESLNNVTTFVLDSINKYKIIRSANFAYDDIESKPKNEIEILVNIDDGVVHKVIFDYFEYQIIGSLEEYNYIFLLYENHQSYC